MAGRGASEDVKTWFCGFHELQSKRHGSFVRKPCGALESSTRHVLAHPRRHTSSLTATDRAAASV